MHRLRSLEPFALCDGQRFADIVQGDERLADVYRSRPERLTPLRARRHLLNAATERLIDQVPKASLAGLAQALEARRDIVIDGQGGSHASKHNKFDVLMPRARDRVLKPKLDTTSRGAATRAAWLVMPAVRGEERSSSGDHAKTPFQDPRTAVPRYAMF